MYGIFGTIMTFALSRDGRGEVTAMSTVTFDKRFDTLRDRVDFEVQMRAAYDNLSNHELHVFYYGRQ